MNKLKEYITLAEKEFQSENKLENRNDAELLITELLGIKKIDIYLSDFALNNNSQQKLEEAFKKAKHGEPIQHILGYAYFRNLKLNVDKRVLIPRPETELLVDKALSLLKIENPKIIDVGTGSGAIALSVADEFKKAKLTAVDISPDALKLAKENAVLNNIENVTFQQGNLLDAGFESNSIDMILANLPYVSEEEYGKLDAKVKDFDPKLALYGGFDGLDLVRKLVEQSKSVLKKNGWLLLEIGYEQGEKTADILKNTGNYKNIEIIKDLNNLDRFVIGQKN